MNKATIRKMALAIGLTFVAIGVWAQDAMLSDSIADKVTLRDGTMVKAQRLPQRAPKDDYVYKYKGVKYTYITNNNYTRFFNTSVHKPSDYGWSLNNAGWYEDENGSYITAASIDADDFPSSGEVYILNDLVGFFTEHTRLGCIADNAFRYMPGVRRIYFQDCASINFPAFGDLNFFIGDKAFADCENLEEVNLMQWTTTGDNHWEALPATAVKRIWGSMLDNSPKAWIRVGTSVYQQYLGSQTWVQVRNRITTYEHSSADITVGGAVYSFLKAEDGTALSNADDQHEEIMKTLRMWNADYMQFNAASLLSDKSRTPDNANLWYTTVTGADASYLKKNDGVLRIYNDPGSYYNYKTIAIRKGAFKNCEDLEAVEFWQTNGRSDNSYSDLRMVIENGAFKNCKYLKEIRLFYKVEDGTDRWQVLGPENIIPGDDIFGNEDEDCSILSDQEAEGLEKTRILVSPDRYVDFINDVNWNRYSAMIVAADYMPTEKKPIQRDGITYNYLANSAGIIGSDQVVTQDFSLWNIPIIVAEIALTVASFGSVDAGANAVGASAMEVTSQASSLMSTNHLATTALNSIDDLTGQLTKKGIENVAKQFGGKELLAGSAEMIERETLMLSVEGVVDGGKFVGEKKLIEFLSVNSYQRSAFLNYLKAYSKVTLSKAKDLMKLAEKLLSYQRFLLDRKIALTSSTNISLMMGTAQACKLALGEEVKPQAFDLGMKQNIMANMHQVGLVGGQFITTPDKDLIYHTYIGEVADNVIDAKIYTCPDDEERTVAIRQKAFQNKKNLQTVTFHENDDVNSHNMTAMCIAIADSAFVGCSNLRTLDLRLYTEKNGTRALGPEHFILCGTDLFAGLDSTKFQIIVAEERLKDFEEDETWANFKRFYTTGKTEEKVNFTEFGVKYSYAYDGGLLKRQKLMGRTIEHLVAVGPDDTYIKDNNGALGFFNDIGSWNNYKLDYAKKGAFRNNANIKNVSFWDLAGWLWTGEAYTDLQMTLQDSCFADCPNLEYVDMLYLRTDGSNIAEPMTPAKVQLGNGVFENSPKVRFKMTDRQMEWFAADTTWAKYQDRFLPCLFLPTDPVVVSKLSDLKYRTDVARPWYDNNASKWGDWLDMTRVKEFSYLNGKFSNNSDLRSFPDFKRFELIGLDYVGGSWFVSCSNLSAIDLPSTIKHIGGWAFYGCSSLKEITIPAAVETIDASAFEYSGLKTVRCEGMKPATLGSNAFNLTSFSGFTIYVPAEAVDAYKKAWPSYAQYIKSNAEDRRITVVDVREPGKLAEQLGLTMIMDGDRLRSVGGAYWKYDSLTVRGHLNGLDVGVLRHMAGSDAWDSDPTDGRLRYLDMRYAYLDKDTKYSYNLWGVDEYLEKANWVGEYMFHNCKALETLILPESVTEIGENAFEEATNLRRLFIGEKLQRYTRDLIEDNKEGLEELVFMTDQFATSESDDPWEGPIGLVYTKKSQLGDYMSDPALTTTAQSITALFEDDQVMIDLAARRFYFPSQYLNVESTKNPRGSYQDGDGYFFYRDRDLKTFDEFQLFSNIRELDYDFENCKGLERITLPKSLERIGYNAFTGCEKLGTIHISADSVPVLERNAFRDLPADFQIIVPKTHVKRYREKWEQYADHIVGDDEEFRNDIIEITLTEPNTLAEKLGLKTTSKVYQGGTSDDLINGKFKYVASITGDYSNIRALKVNGPISGADFTVMRYLAGYDVMADLNDFLQFTGTRNYFGRLEYIDLYDANIVPTDYMTDGLSWTAHVKCLFEGEYDILPGSAFGECYSLKTLILPRSCKEVRTRAFLQCEYLETLVIGDECEKFNWNSLDDCASMTRMYILSKKKMEMDQDNWFARAVCNNYSPTFDAFYVRPSLYNEYVADNAYTGSQQRTNNISSGAFKDDESFAAFAAHAAATEDDLRQVSDISGWFRGHETAVDLNALQYTSIDSLRTADMALLTALNNITLPDSIKGVGKDAFKNATGLRYVDMSKCAEYAPTLAAEGGVRSLGIGENTLAYVPAEYGKTADVNVAVSNGRGYQAQTFRLVDGLDYCVPYAVTADKVENTRTLAKSTAPYTICLPYSLDVPAGAKVYRLSGRSDNELVFAQHTGRMEALQPYLVWAEQEDALLNVSGEVQMPASGGNTYGGQQQSPGYVMRGTLDAIGNQEAVELGAYVMNDDSMWHPVLSDTDAHKAVTIPAFRCFLLQSRSNGARGAIGMTLEDATGIEQLRTIDSDGTERVYDLSGRLLSAPTKGINIVNGKKVLK